MRTARPRSLLERNADSDLWVRTLSQIPTLFGRLLYLVGLRNPLTGRYEHHGLALLFGEKDADKAMSKSHRKVFQEWLAASLEEKFKDLEQYLSESGEQPADVLRHWSVSDAWKTFPPGGAVGPERSLYTSDMRNLIRMMLSRFGDDGPDRGA